MPDWALALALKFAVAYALAALYFFGLLRPLEWLRKKLPRSRWVEVLFRERGTDRPTEPTSAPHRPSKQKAIGRR